MRKNQRGLSILTAVALGVTALLPTAALADEASAALPALPDTPAAKSTLYVDCAASTNGDGSAADKAFNSLAAINAQQLTPGTHVLFKRGVTCQGEFAPQGKGSAADPIVIADYGTAAERARIDATGSENGVLLKNNAYLTLTSLEVTVPGDNTQEKHGVYVYGEDSGDLPGITVAGLYIHDVRGQLPAKVDPSDPASFAGKAEGSSGGIIIDAMGERVPTAFVDLQIRNNRLEQVDRQGIYMWSNWCARAELDRWKPGNAQVRCRQDWHPHKRVTIAGNMLSDVGGDGIVVTGTVGALVEHNVLQGFNQRAKSYNAGIWVANSQDVLFQYNEASGGVGTLDSQGFDIDHATQNIVMRYNYSHDNQGGFLLLCPDAWGTRNNLVHDNLSVNDAARTIQHGCGHPTIQNTKFFNNTIYVGAGISGKLFDLMKPADQFATFNNVIYKEGAGSYTLGTPGGTTFENSAFTGLAAPANAQNTVTGEVKFVTKGARHPASYQLVTGSAGIGAGKADTAQQHDFYGTAYPAAGAINVGAYQGAGAQAAVPLEKAPVWHPVKPSISSTPAEPQELQNPIAFDLGKVTASANYSEASKPPSNAIDGKRDTLWHSPWHPTAEQQHPFYLTIDLGQEYDVTGIGYTGRPTAEAPEVPASGSWNGLVKDYRVFVTSQPFDPDHLGTPAAQGTFERKNSEQAHNFPAVRGRYVTLYMESEYGSTGQFSSINELRIGGTLPSDDPQPPAPAAAPEIIWQLPTAAVAGGQNMAVRYAGLTPNQLVSVTLQNAAGERAGIGYAMSDPQGQAIVAVPVAKSAISGEYLAIASGAGIGQNAQPRAVTVVATPAPAPDTEALQAAVDAAGALRQADYTVDSWQAFEEALADAKRVLKDPQDQAQVNDALAVLQKAQQALQKKPAEPVVPDTEDLQVAVKDAVALRQADYTVDSWRAFAKALADAKRVLKDPQDQAQVNDALAVLQKAQKALQKKPAKPVKPDTEALQAAVDAAGALPQADYTADSWQAFAKALADAKRVLKDPQDQAQVNDALSVLQKAQKALQKKPLEPVVPDTEALQSAVDAAGALRQADYTVDSWQVFAKALADAKRVLKDPQDQAQVDDALAALQEAQKALQKAEQPVTPTPDQPDQPTPDQPVTPTPDNPKPVKPGKSDVQRTPDTGASLAWTVFASLSLLSVGGVLAARRRNA